MKPAVAAIVVALWSTIPYFARRRPETVAPTKRGES